MAGALLEIVDLVKSYPAAGGSGELRILDRVNLELSRGDSLAIVGPSGSGKSTLLNIVGTLDRADSGRVLLDGKDLAGLSEEEIATVRNRDIGFVFQAHHLLPQCTVLENVLTPTLASGDSALMAAAPERAKSLLARVGLGERLDHKPGQLSGGERQRVAVVRALINRPKLLLADEPTGALDRHSAAVLATLLMELNAEENVSLILVTHSLDLASKARRVFELREGRLVPQQTI